MDYFNSLLSVCGKQIVGSVPEGMRSSGVAIGYEPLWAIGTGKMPSVEEIANVHAYIRQCLTARLGTDGQAVRILYGGSVKQLSFPSGDDRLAGFGADVILDS